MLLVHLCSNFIHNFHVKAATHLTNLSSPIVVPVLGKYGLFLAWHWNSPLENLLHINNRSTLIRSSNMWSLTSAHNKAKRLKGGKWEPGGWVHMAVPDINTFSFRFKRGDSQRRELILFQELMSKNNVPQGISLRSTFSWPSNRSFTISHTEPNLWQKSRNGIAFCTNSTHSHSTILPIINFEHT